MKKTINIGGVEQSFSSNGATPIKYRRIFKNADFFKDITNLQSLNPDNLCDADIEQVEKIAYAMSEDANKPDMTFETWLEQFEFFALIKAIPEVIGLITDNIDTQNISNSKN